jgi:adenylate cyclase
VIQSEANRSWRDHPSNPDSLDLTLRANALMNGAVTREINANAQRLYQQAIELDPENADAFVGLAWTYLNIVQENWEGPWFRRDAKAGGRRRETSALDQTSTCISLCCQV